MWCRQRHWRFLQWLSSYWMTMLSVIMHWKHLASFSGGNTWELLRSFCLTFLSSASNKRLLTGQAIDFSEEWTGWMHLFCLEILQDVIVVLLLSSAPYPSLLTVWMALIQCALVSWSYNLRIGQLNLWYHQCMPRLSCSLKLSQGVFLALSPYAGYGHLASCVSSRHVPDIDESVIKF